MRESADNKENPINTELVTLFQRIDVNAQTFGMSSDEVDMIKKDCKIAYQHKVVLDKVEDKRKP